MSVVTSKVLYFTVGAVATASEVAEISRLETAFRNVQVRDGSSLADTKYGENFESFDFLAGPGVPAEYSGIDGAVVIAVPSATNPDDFEIFPAVIALDVSDANTQKLAAVKAEVANGLASLTDLAEHASVTWSSENESFVTVDTDGNLTPIGAGGPVDVTATLQAAASITGIAGEADDDIFTKVAHGLQTGDAVDLLDLGSGTGFGAVDDTRYVIRLSADTFKLATSYANAVAGTAIDITGDATAAVICKARVSAACAVTVTA